jgi:hypothetical protein
MLIRTGEKTPDRRWLQNPVSNPLWAACTLVTENARCGVEGGGGWWVGGGCTSAAPECQGARIILRREARLRCIFTRRPCNCGTVGASRERHTAKAMEGGGGGCWRAGAYETQASTLWTLVVKERSLTSSELAMYRGSLSSHACAQRGRWCWGGGAGRCAWVGGVRRVPHRALLAQGARAARHLRHVDVVVGVDEQVKGARLVEQRQEGDRGRDLPDDGLDL